MFAIVSVKGVDAVEVVGNPIFATSEGSLKASVDP